jgi:6-phosphofructokinase 1
METLNTQVEVLGVPHIKSPLRLGAEPGDAAKIFVPEDARVRFAVETGTGRDLPADILFEKAGAREKIFFDPKKTTAAIVTCGGICPGLNNVIRSVVMGLFYNYGVKNIWGIRYGYAGLNPKLNLTPLRLTPETVAYIHEKGGTFLGSSRGKQPFDVIIDYLCELKVNILFCAGGDGTLRGANAIADEIAKRKLPISVIGIPKTIDNDVMYMTRTFGLATASEIARNVLSCAHVEAQNAYNGIGLVKLMGRDAGFIATVATLASQEVNFCLIPEVPITLEGPQGFLENLRKRLEERHHALVVVAEGAGQELMRQLPTETDSSGNKRYGDIGVYLKEQIVSYFKRRNMPAEVKYFDPSYFIRSVPANVDDAILCDQFARNAVHAAMAGKTKMVVSFLNGTFANIPIPLAVSKKKQVDTDGIFWTSVLAATGQPKRWS